MDFDPRTVDELSDRVKRALRKRMSGLRSALPESAAAARSARIVEQLATLPAIADAKAVALFWPMLERREVDLRGLDAMLRRAGKALYYPFMDPVDDGALRTGFRRVDDPALLAERGRRFAEPPPGAPEARAGDLDAIVVPALAVTDRGERLGYGAGFYDATLPEFCPPAVAIVVAFDFQRVIELPACEHDVACAIVVTDRR